MSTKQHPILSVEDYLAIERSAEQRHEYYQGEIFAMAGGSPAHNLIVANSVTSLTLQLKGRPCRAYASDMRVKVNPLGKYTYPDIVVTCGQEIYDDVQQDTLTNPLLIMEVLSDSTEGYDRGDKFAHYQKLNSLKEYVLISQKISRIERFVRQHDGSWLLHVFEHLEMTVQLDAIGCKLKLADVYDKIDLAAN
ncbi:MAG: Uma2 family endonuclease [Gammaproteobacteria bacterium]